MDSWINGLLAADCGCVPPRGTSRSAPAGLLRASLHSHRSPGRLLQNAPGEGTGPTGLLIFVQNPVGRVPPRGNPAGRTPSTRNPVGRVPSRGALSIFEHPAVSLNISKYHQISDLFISNSFSPTFNFQPATFNLAGRIPHVQNPIFCS